ncbi:MAG: hypothetical protein CMP20_01880 [Rickettsiales bacterium]|nr:hypothetical protein [Rickettsiales bacterium]
MDSRRYYTLMKAQPCDPETGENMGHRNLPTLSQMYEMYERWQKRWDSLPVTTFHEDDNVIGTIADLYIGDGPTPCLMATVVFYTDVYRNWVLKHDLNLAAEWNTDSESQFVLLGASFTHMPLWTLNAVKRSHESVRVALDLSAAT